MNPTLKGAGAKRLKVKPDKLLSIFASNVNLRRCNKEAAKRCKDGIKSCKWLDLRRRAGVSPDGARIALPITVGRCRLKPAEHRVESALV